MNDTINTNKDGIVSLNLKSPIVQAKIKAHCEKLEQYEHLLFRNRLKIMKSKISQQEVQANKLMMEDAIREAIISNRPVTFIDSSYAAYARLGNALEKFIYQLGRKFMRNELKDAKEYTDSVDCEISSTGVKVKLKSLFTNKSIKRILKSSPKFKRKKQ